MSSALDAAVAAITPPAPAQPTATKLHHSLYRECVEMLAGKTAISPDRYGAFSEAVTLLGVTPEVLQADVAACLEAERLRGVVANREQLNAGLVKANEYAAEFEAGVKKRRQEIVDARNRILSDIQVANAAAKQLATLERDNARLFGA